MIRGRPPRALAYLLAMLGAQATRSGVSFAATRTSMLDVLDYVADADCPGHERFVALLNEALDPPERSRLATAPGVRIRVEIRPALGGYRGSLEKIDPLGASAPRVFVSPICADVAQALALTAAFSLAPAAHASPPASAPVTVTEQRAPVPGPKPRPAGDASGWWSVGVGALAGGWVSPGPLTGFEVIAARTVPLTRTSQTLAASLRLGTSYVRSDWVASDLDARFGLWTGTLDACGLARLFGGGLEVGLCASGESGWLRAQGVRVANPHASDSLWLALGGGPIARVALGHRWGVELRGALRRPLRHVHFAFDAPALPIGETAAVTWTAALAITARFP